MRRGNARAVRMRRTRGSRLERDRVVRDGRPRSNGSSARGSFCKKYAASHRDATDDASHRPLARDPDDARVQHARIHRFDAFSSRARRRACRPRRIFDDFGARGRARTPGQRPEPLVNTADGCTVRALDAFADVRAKFSLEVSTGAMPEAVLTLTGCDYGGAALRGKILSGAARTGRISRARICRRRRCRGRARGIRI